VAVIKFEVQVDDKQATAKLEKLGDSLKNVENQNKATASAGKQTEAGFSSLGSSVLRSAAAIGGAFLSFQALSKAVKGSFNAAVEAETAQNNLQTALESTGRYVPGLTERMLAFSSAIQRQTTVSDEAVTAIQTLFVQMTNLDEKGIQQATRASIGLAKTLGMDVNSAAMLVMKAVEGNVGALSRYGFRLDETLPKQQAIAKLLGELEGLFKRAQAETETTAGAIAQMKNSFDDLGEALATRTLPFMKMAISTWTDWISASSEAAGLNIEQIAAQKKAAAANIEYRQALMAMRAELGLNTGQLGKLGKEFNNNWKAVSDWIVAGNLGEETAQKWGVRAAELEGKLSSLGKTTVIVDTETTKADKEAAKAKDDLAAKVQQYYDKAFPLEAELRKEAELMAAVTKAVNDGALGFEKLMLAAMAYGKLHPLEPIIETARLIPVELAKSETGLLAMVANMKPPITELKATWLDTMQAFGEEAFSVASRVQETWATMYAYLGGISAQYQKNEEIRLNNEYKKRLDAINKSKKSEEEKQKAIMALDAEYDIKRQAIQRTAAKQQKAASLIQATINVAEGITKALAQGGIFGAALAAIVAALGAVQIRLIASQPIPFANGAVFNRPTEFYTPAGQKVLMGEAGTEILLPERKLREIIRSEGMGGGAMNISIPIDIAFGSVTMRKEVVAVVNMAGQKGDLKLPAERVLV